MCSETRFSRECLPPLCYAAGGGDGGGSSFDEQMRERLAAKKKQFAKVAEDGGDDEGKVPTSSQRFLIRLLSALFSGS